MGKQSEWVMRKYFFPVLFISLLIFPADAFAGSKTKAQVLSYMASLPSQSSKKVLSGQFIGWCGEIDSGLFDRINSISGHYPGLMSGNYAAWGGCSSSSTIINTVNTHLKAHWAAGGLVEVAWHAFNPATMSWDHDTNVNLVDLVTNGTTTNTNWKSMLDVVATGLADLRDAGVVVIFRPFLEMNGYPNTGFWWAGEDGTQYRNMWIYTYNYLTTTKGLNNLLWMFAPDASGLDPSTWYPGSSYVDLVGVDYYSSSGRFQQASQYSYLTGLGKPFAMAEIGQCDYSGSGCDAKDSTYIITDLNDGMPNAIYWSNWNSVWALDNHNNLSTLLSDPRVINRDDNPSGDTDQSKKPSSPARVLIQ
jgi:mannan endo-1,4-beta-mannosidase